MVRSSKEGKGQGAPIMIIGFLCTFPSPCGVWMGKGNEASHFLLSPFFSDGKMYVALRSTVHTVRYPTLLREGREGESGRLKENVTGADIPSPSPFLSSPLNPNSDKPPLLRERGRKGGCFIRSRKGGRWPLNFLPSWKDFKSIYVFLRCCLLTFACSDAVWKTKYIFSPSLSHAKLQKEKAPPENT